MPAIRRYVVKQTREVEVTANSAVDACRIAEAAFEHGQNADGGVARDKGPAGVWGNTDTHIRTVEVWAEEKR